MSNTMDFKTVVIHGKNAPKSRDINLNNVKTKAEMNRTGGMNAASLERKIDAGTVTVPKTIPRDISTIFQKHRTSIVNAEGKSMTQDAFAKQCCVPRVDTKFIQQLESGQLLLNHDNKTTLRALQRKLKIEQFVLP
jgi:hypothetical protein